MGLEAPSRKLSGTYLATVENDVGFTFVSVLGLANYRWETDGILFVRAQVNVVYAVAATQSFFQVTLPDFGPFFTQSGQASGMFTAASGAAGAVDSAIATSNISVESSSPTTAGAIGIVQAWIETGL